MFKVSYDLSFTIMLCLIIHLSQHKNPLSSSLTRDIILLFTIDAFCLLMIIQPLFSIIEAKHVPLTLFYLIL